MNFKLAILKSNDRLLLKSFSSHTDASAPLQSQSIEIQEIDQLAPSALFYTETELSEDLKQALNSQTKYFPIRKASDYGLSLDSFDHLDNKTALKTLNQASSAWLLNNNISLLEELIKVQAHLKKLWPNDRTTFFEELWFILKTNLHLHDFKIIFNDLESSGKEAKEKKVGEEKKERQKLMRVKIEGEKTPHPFPGDDIADKLMGHYQNEFVNPFQIVEYNEAKGELVICATVNKSPVLIMGTVPELTRLQTALLSALFDGLQTET